MLNFSLRHDNDLVGHGQRFLLVMSHINKGDAELFMHTFQLKLHLLAHF